MYKLITVLVAMIPIVLFLRTVFFRRSQVLKQASADFKRQVDYLVWGILAFIALALVFSLFHLLYPIWR